MLFGIHYKTNTKVINKQLQDNANAVYIFGTIDLRFTNPIEAIKTAKELTIRQNNTIKYSVFKESYENYNLFTPDKVVDTMEEYFAKKKEQTEQLLTQSYTHNN